MSDNQANMGEWDREDPPQSIVAIDDNHPEEWSRVCSRHNSVEASSVDGDALQHVRSNNSNDNSSSASDSSGGGSEDSHDNESPNYADSTEQGLLRQSFPARMATPPILSQGADASSQASLSFGTQPSEGPGVNEQEQPSDPEAQGEPIHARNNRKNLKRKALTDLEGRPSKSTEGGCCRTDREDAL